MFSPPFCVVAVFEVTNSDAEVILKNAVHVPADDGVVRLRGLPYSCTESDIVQFFSGEPFRILLQ